MQAVIAAFEQSSAFTDLAEPTGRDYRRIIRAIEKKFGRFPIAGLNDRRARGIFREWRDELAVRSRRQADYHIQVLARILSWAYDGGLVERNPVEKLGRVYRGSRRDQIWADGDIERFLATSP